MHDESLLDFHGKLVRNDVMKLVFIKNYIIDYAMIYSPIIDDIIFWYLIGLTIQEKLDICWMVVVTTYLYGSINNYVYIKVLKDLKFLNHVFQIPKKFTQSSSKSSYMD